jgi:hypothetical protein
VRNGEQGIKVTCAAPHGLKAGQFVALYFPSTGVVPFQFAITHDGITEPVSWQNVMTFPVSDTEFVVPGWFTGPITPVALPTGAQLWRKWAGAPVRDCVDLINTQPDCSAWFSVPHAATDQYVTDLVTYIAQNLAPGRHFWLEYTNEWWNGGGSYPQYGFIARMGREFALTRPGDPIWNTFPALLQARWYVLRSGQIRNLARAAWSAAGRDVADLGLVLGSQWSNSSVTLNLARNCADLYDTQGRSAGDPAFTGPIQFEAVAVGTYQYINPCYNGTLTTAQYDAMTVPQVMDIGDAFMLNIRATQYGVLSTQHAQNVATLNATGRPGVQLLCYEGGTSVMGLGGSQTQQRLRTVAWSLHPRARSQFLAHLSLFDEAGVVEYVKNGLAGTYVMEGDFGHCYATYVGLEQQSGTGDGMDGQADNRPSLMDPTTKLAKYVNLAPGGIPLVSPVGLAVEQWGW